MKIQKEIQHSNMTFFSCGGLHVSFCGRKNDNWGRENKKVLLRVRESLVCSVERSV